MSQVELSAVECRVLGSLIEKERSTPQNYPLTLNALRLACNQTTNREPVVNYDDPIIEGALSSLREQKLTRIVYSTSNRAAKYRHVFNEALRLDDAELAVLCVLMLRGPQTVGEIKGRTERLFAFADLGDVQAALDRLSSRDDGPLAMRLERQPGQKDPRYAHLLGGDSAQDSLASAAFASVPTGTSPRPALAQANTPAPVSAAVDIESLAAEVRQLRSDLDALRDELEAFRSQFD